MSVASSRKASACFQSCWSVSAGATRIWEVLRLERFELNGVLVGEIAQRHARALALQTDEDSTVESCLGIRVLVNVSLPERGARLVDSEHLFVNGDEALVRWCELMVLRDRSFSRERLAKFAELHVRDTADDRPLDRLRSTIDRLECGLCDPDHGTLLSGRRLLGGRLRPGTGAPSHDDDRAAD
jgi:hypothetical protein